MKIVYTVTLLFLVAAAQHDGYKIIPGFDDERDYTVTYDQNGRPTHKLVSGGNGRPVSYLPSYYKPGIKAFGYVNPRDDVHPAGYYIPGYKEFPNDNSNVISHPGNYNPRNNHPGNYHPGNYHPGNYNSGNNVFDYGNSRAVIVPPRYKALPDGNSHVVIKPSGYYFPGYKDLLKSQSRDIYYPGNYNRGNYYPGNYNSGNNVLGYGNSRTVVVPPRHKALHGGSSRVVIKPSGYYIPGHKDLFKSQSRDIYYPGNYNPGNNAVSYSNSRVVVHLPGHKEFPNDESRIIYYNPGNFNSGYHNPGNYYHGDNPLNKYIK